MEGTMRARTIFLSKLIRLYSILISLAMVTHKQAAIETVTSLIQNQPALFLLGLIAMLSGLAMILAHNVWSGGALPVIVTLLGWWTLVKGLLFLFLSLQETAGLFLGGFTTRSILTSTSQSRSCWGPI